MKKVEALIKLPGGAMDGAGERGDPGQVRRLGRTIVDVVPAIVDALLASRSSRVHREAMVLAAGGHKQAPEQAGFSMRPMTGHHDDGQEHQ